MLKILLKKQIYELFRNFFYNQKTGKGKTKSSTIFAFVIYGLLIAVGFSGIFGVLALSLCKPMVQSGYSWLYFMIIALISTLFGVFGSVFTTNSQLYNAKDNDFILSMPIPVKDVVFSRLLGVYLMGAIYSAFVFLPCVVIYAKEIKSYILPVISGLWFYFLISCFVLFVSCVLGFFVTKIGKKVKNKSFVTVLLSVAFIIAYYVLYYRANAIIQTLVANAEKIGEKIKGTAYPLYLFGTMGEGSIKAILLFSVLILGVLAITIYVITKSFVTTVTASDKSNTETGKKVSFAKRRSKEYALLMRELKHFTSSANYMLNCGFGILFLLAAAVFIMIKGDFIFTKMAMSLGGDAGLLPVIIPAIICVTSGIIDITAPSVSLEGKSIWLAQSLPVTSWQVLSAKLKMHLLLADIPVLLCSLASIYVYRAGIIISLLIIVLPLAFVLFTAQFGLFVNLKSPNLTWTNEIAPIKQSFGVFLAILIGSFLSAAIFIPYLFLSEIMSPELYLGICLLIFAIVDAVLFRYLRTTGARIFATL